MQLEVISGTERWCALTKSLRIVGDSSTRDLDHGVRLPCESSEASDPLKWSQVYLNISRCRLGPFVFVYGVSVEATVGPRTDLPIAIPYLPRTVFVAEPPVVNIHTLTTSFSLVHSSNYSQNCASIDPLSDPSVSWSTLAQESSSIL